MFPGVVEGLPKYGALVFAAVVHYGQVKVVV